MGEYLRWLFQDGFDGRDCSGRTGCECVFAVSTGSADRKAGRSAIEYFAVLEKQLDGIKADLARLASE